MPGKTWSNNYIYLDNPFEISLKMKSRITAFGHNLHLGRHIHHGYRALFSILGLSFLTLFIINPSMDKKLHTLWNMTWNYLYIPRLQWYNQWDLGRDMWFHLIVYGLVLSMFELKLIHASKRSALRRIFFFQLEFCKNYERFGQLLYKHHTTVWHNFPQEQKASIG